MPRQLAATRHRASAPDDPDVDADPLDVITALHHPTRRWLAELLWIEGPASVGSLARRTGLAVGSISHHLKALHKYGFIAPAPELARDTRESWWRGLPRRLSWSADDYLPGTPGRQIAHAAELENLRHQMRAVQQWFGSLPDQPEDVRRLAGSTDTYVAATPEQAKELYRRLNAVLVAWSDDCRADAQERPDVERQPIRAFARVFPSGPVHP